MVDASDSIEQAGMASNQLSVPIAQTRKGRGKTRGFSILKKRRKKDNEKLKVIIPPGRSKPVGPGTNDFITELSVTVDQHARHDVEAWKKVPDITKDRIVAHMLDTFDIPDTQHTRDVILQRAIDLYRNRRSRLHVHFLKFNTMEERLKNIPEDIVEAEWKFLCDYFCSEKFRRDPITGKEPNYHELWEMTHMKDGHWVNEASAEINDEVKRIVVDQLQEMEEGADKDSIINEAFVKVVGEKNGFCRGQGSGVKTTSKRYLQEQLQAQTKKAEEELNKRENVESKLAEVQKQLAKERKSRKSMEARLQREQKEFKKDIFAIISQMQGSQWSHHHASIFNTPTNSSDSSD